MELYVFRLSRAHAPTMGIDLAEFEHAPKGLHSRGGVQMCDPRPAITVEVGNQPLMDVVRQSRLLEVPAAILLKKTTLEPTTFAW